ncbi:Protein SPIRAL1-like 1, variant 2 [Stylosanthes scabra]|uniref:Protein SPIRAL1-like 1, variant 2 n=1 Tax=Stylosanthes scabra TaxID=79078 RepID=A0ABU6QDD2_9FABA|nr:Protein SPIRAL1-like 1, variant 2 [Stylosanthes scabra]
MGRGVSSGGGQSSLGYLFGNGEGEAPKPAPKNTQPEAQTVNDVPPPKPAPPKVTIDPNKPAGINSNSIDGQNTGNFITDRPSTKVHAAPGGGSSLGYLFGGPGLNMLESKWKWLKMSETNEEIMKKNLEAKI